VVGFDLASFGGGRGEKWVFEEAGGVIGFVWKYDRVREVWVRCAHFVLMALVGTVWHGLAHFYVGRNQRGSGARVVANLHFL